MGKGIVKLGEGKWAVKDGNLLAAKETNGRFKNTEFTVSRGTRASYVGRDGLIKESNLQDVNLVNNGDFSELGSELVTNGDFSSGTTGWSSGNSTLSVVDGKLKVLATNAFSYARQNVTVVSGKTYKITANFFYNSLVGNIEAYDGTTNTISEQLSEDGVITLYVTPSSTNLRLTLLNRNGSSGDFNYWDNVSVKEVDPNDYWTFSGDSFTFPDGAARIARTTSTTFIQQNVLTSGRLYKVEFDVLDKPDNNGTFIVRLGANNVYDVSTYEGTRFSKYITSSGIDFRIYSSSDNGVIYVDNIVVSEVKTDTPRIDFTDNTDGHLLLEPQSTNLLPYSEDFTTWTIQSGTTVTSNTTETLSPSGEYNSSKIVGNGTSGILKASVSSAGGSNTKSIYIKGTQNGQVVYLKDPNQTVNNKALTLTTEWVRYSLTETQTSNFGIWIDDIPTEGIYMWGGQVEALPYATSYIPTNGSTVTRDADTCTDAGSSVDFNSEEGVLYAEIAALETTSTISNYISISDGTYNNRASILFTGGSTNSIRFFLRVGGTSQIDTSENVTDVKSFNKVAFKYKANDFAVWINGVEVATDTSGSVWASGTINELAFTEIGTTLGAFRGKCKAVRVYKEALSDTDLQNLTS